MKFLAITIALAGVVATAPLNAQVLSSTSINDRGSTIPPADGAWILVGSDRTNNRIYERRTRDRNGNVTIQRARRDRYGNMNVFGTSTTRRSDIRRNCDYSRSRNSVGDIIFARTNAANCNDEYVRENDGWYQLGRGRDNNSIYERRIRDGNGDLIIQRARRTSDGSLTIISTRRANSSDRQWRRDRDGS